MAFRKSRFKTWVSAFAKLHVQGDGILSIGIIRPHGIPTVPEKIKA